MIYADYNATAPLRPEVLEAMQPYLLQEFGNPSSSHQAGRRARTAVETAREQAADFLHASVQEIFFTSGGTEADNWAVQSAAEEMLAKGKNHVITTAFEHPAVLETCRSLSRFGIEITYIHPDRDGRISSDAVKAAVTDRTGLVSVMYVNNEVGTIQPVEQIGAFCREKGILFHTDAVQAAGNLPMDMDRIKADLLSLSGHKLGAMKGTGLLYVRQGLRLPPFLHGGGQERKRRAGTENVPGIVGLGRALELTKQTLSEKEKRLSLLREELEKKILLIPGAQINGAGTKICSTINASFAGVEGEGIVLSLDRKGICISSGSACSSCGGEPSHVLTAMGLTKELAKSSVRISLGEEHTMEDIAVIARELAQAVEQFRQLFGMTI